MIARWRPFGEHRAAMPSGDPLGLKGYCSVSLPSGLQYLHALSIADHISGLTLALH